MTNVLLDTHAWAWSMYDSSRLSVAARTAMRQADVNWISPASAFEIAQKVRLGKWPELEPFVDRLAEAAQRQKVSMTRMDVEICVAAGRMSWAHRDPFDRLLATTALIYRIPIVSVDKAFDDIITRIW